MKRIISFVLVLLSLNMIIFSIGCNKSDNQTEAEKLSILPFEEEIFPYKDVARNYIECSNNCFVTDFALDKHIEKPVKISWNCEYENVDEFIVEYGTKEDLSDKKTVVTNSRQRNIEVYNLYKGTKYYVRLTAKMDGEDKVVTSSFNMTDKGPRVLKVNGIYNVRDIGGYKTDSGKITKQGLIIRGGALSPSTDTAYDFVNLSQKGKTIMKEDFKIRLDMDLRPKYQNLDLEVSPIPDAKLEYFAVNGYDTAFMEGNKKDYKKVFSTFADVNNYPIYIHCTGGADRTGTIVFILNALLGVDETDLIKDYEFTSFSVYDVRDTQKGIYAGYYKKFRDEFEKYMGITLKDKAETYLKTIGITDSEINTIREILIEN